MRGRYEAPDSGRSRHQHHLRCEVQDIRVWISDCEFQLPYRIGEGYDLGGCWEGSKYRNRQGAVFAACEVYVRYQGYNWGFRPERLI